MRNKKYIVLALAACLGITFPDAPKAEGSITGAAKDSVEYIELGETVPVKILADYREQGYSGVVDLGTITYIDDEKLVEVSNKRLDGFAKESDLSKGNCSAIIKPLKINGKMTPVMARNMDLPVSHYPLYIFRINQPGKYKTLNIGYMNSNIESFDQIIETGKMDKTMYYELTYRVTDVMNEKGLVIEANMRDTCEKLASKGTNPGKKRFPASALQRYMGDHFATIAEALEGIKELDLYTPNSPVYNWHTSFAMMDATGRYGVLEFVTGGVIWHEKQVGQTNFWIDKKCQEIAKLDQGVGRWSLLMQHYNSLKTTQDMEEIVKKVYYSPVFSKEAKEAGYDVLTEMTNANVQNEIDLVMSWKEKYGIKVDDEELAAVQKIADEQTSKKIAWNHKYVMAPQNMLKVYTVYDFITHSLTQLPVTAKKLSGMQEVSAINYSVNPFEKVFHAHFFEQEDVFHFGFDELTIEKK